MVKHIILWKLKKEGPEKICKIKADIKEHLEGLKGQIPGLMDIRVEIHPLPSSNADLMLDSTFDSAEALAAYAGHPAHVAVADTYVRPFTEVRMCLDYEIQS